MSKLILALALVLNSFLVSAQSLPKMRELNGKKIVFQSQKVKYVKSYNLYKTRIVTKLGTELFQVSDAYFKCSPSRCRLSQTITRGYFRSCKAKKDSFECRGKLEEDSGEVTERTPDYWDSVGEDGEPNRRVDPWDGSEYPERSDDSWETDGVVLF